jgi:hypothetical protein
MLHSVRLIALMMEAANTSETSANLYQTTRRNIPADIFIVAAARIWNLTCLFAYFCIFVSFKDFFSSAVNMASNGRMISKSRIGRNLEGSDCGVN